MSSKNRYRLIDFDKIVSDPEVTVKELFNFLNESCHISENHEAYNNMICSVKKTLNHAKPYTISKLSPFQIKLQEILGQEQIPEDFEIPENQIWHLQEIFTLFRKIPTGNLNCQSAQLFFKNGNIEYNEEQSLINEITGCPKQVIFQFGEPGRVKHLRFDPLNDYAKIRINSIQLLNQGKPIDIELKLSSNAMYSENGEYLFDTTDPQVFIDFPLANSVELDEVVVDLEYLQKGNGILEELLKQKNDEIEAYKYKTLKLNTLLQTTKDLNDCLEKEYPQKT